MTTFSGALLNEYASATLKRIVRAVDRELVYERLYVSDERFYRNPYAQLALVAEHTESIRVATGVTNPYTRNPAHTAAAIATIDEASDGRAVLGLGAGSPMALDPIGVAQQRPIGTVRDAVDVIRRLLDGERVTVDRDEFELHDLALDFEPDGRVPIHVAGRGPQILGLAGHVGDAAIAGAGLTSVSGMEYAVDRVAAGAAAADRSPDEVPVVCWAFLSIAEDRDDAVDAVLPLIARIVGAVPLDTLTAIGVDRAAAEAIKALPDPDEVSAEQLREAVPPSVVEQFAIAGTPPECREHVERLQGSGVEEIAVLPFENAEHDALGNLSAFSARVAREVSGA